MSSAKTLAKADEVMSAGRIIVRKVTPYFRAMLLKLVPRVVEGYGTVGVTARAILLYDPEVVATWTPIEMAGVLVHENMHLWLGHFTRCGTRDHGEWNQAGDRAINPGILELGLKLPKIYGEDMCMPADVGMRNGLTADEYYRAPSGSGGGTPSVGRGACGGCAGNPLPGEPADTDPEGRSEAEIGRVARHTSELITAAQHDKTLGRVPASWASFAAGSLAPAKVDWRRMLGSVLRNTVAFRPGASVHRYDAPSRRQAGLGFGQGCPVLPRSRAPQAEVAIVADTSYSMRASQIQEILAETASILKAVGARATFVACDTSVHGIAPVRTAAQAAALLKGGGGTDFRPAFEALANVKPRPEIIVFATDGYGIAPAEAPHRTRVIWLLIGDETARPAPWGECIKCEVDAS
jgi:predicted metal-dependent peptidase